MDFLIPEKEKGLEKFDLAVMGAGFLVHSTIKGGSQ
jgi:hypothetical protein